MKSLRRNQRALSLGASSLPASTEVSVWPGSRATQSHRHLWGILHEAHPPTSYLLLLSAASFALSPTSPCLATFPPPGGAGRGCGQEFGHDLSRVKRSLPASCHTLSSPLGPSIGLPPQLPAAQGAKLSPQGIPRAFPGGWSQE